MRKAETRAAELSAYVIAVWARVTKLSTQIIKGTDGAKKLAATLKKLLASPVIFSVFQRGSRLDEKKFPERHQSCFDKGGTLRVQ